ncbi:hypothetical protein Q8A73_018166 [Channa argus]|nr:hypothetical protein Q8A73_018166 [Channa argus]
MALLTWIKWSLFLVLMLQRTGNGAAKSTTPSRTSLTSPTTNASSQSESNSSILSTKTPGDEFGLPDLLRWLIVFGSLAALLIFVVTVTMWMRNKGNETRINENMPLASNPAQPQSGPEACRDKTEPDDAAYYATVCFTKKTGSTAKVQTTDEVDGEVAEMTYSTVKFSPSAPEASTDPNNLYATVNKPKRQ